MGREGGSRDRYGGSCEQLRQEVSDIETLKNELQVRVGENG